MNKYNCPVCGYTELTDPPSNHEICPCCGTEFGLDDLERGIPQLTFDWIKNNCPWFSDETRPPPGWNPVKQLADAELLPTFMKQGSAPAPAVQTVDLREWKTKVVFGGEVRNPDS